VSLQNRAILATALAVLISGAWIGFRQYSVAPAQLLKMTSEGVEQLPGFSFPDVKGNNRESGEWKSSILVINFWATWCPPCREEMPLFIELQKRFADQGVQFVSIAIDEPGLVRDFYDVYGINFPTLIGGVEAIKLANTLGNRFDSLPFTAIFDRNGKSHFIQAGQITRKTLIAQLGELLKRA
jgi:thiol-disulfide isomerase/thioredoxin